MKNCVLSRRAWSQDGRVMDANPVHVIHLRKQRLMRNSALIIPRPQVSPRKEISIRIDLAAH